MFSERKKEYDELRVLDDLEKTTSILRCFVGGDIRIRDKNGYPIGKREVVSKDRYFEGELTFSDPEVRGGEYGLVVNHIITARTYRFNIEDLEELHVEKGFGRHHPELFIHKEN